MNPLIGGGHDIRGLTSPARLRTRRLPRAQLLGWRSLREKCRRNSCTGSPPVFANRFSQSHRAQQILGTQIKAPETSAPLRLPVGTVQHTVGTLRQTFPHSHSSLQSLRHVLCALVHDQARCLTEVSAVAEAKKGDLRSLVRGSVADRPQLSRLAPLRATCLGGSCPQVSEFPRWYSSLPSV